MLNSKILHYFATIVEQGSYTKAAEHLGIAQSALSIAMRKFEDKVGMTLLIRSSKGVTVTKEGEVLLAHSKGFLARIHDAETALNELRGIEQGEVSIGIPGMLFILFSRDPDGV